MQVIRQDARLHVRSCGSTAACLYWFLEAVGMSSWRETRLM